MKKPIEENRPAESEGIESPLEPKRYARRLPLAERGGYRVRYLKVEEIHRIEAASQYLRLYVEDKAFLVRGTSMTMEKLASRLDPEQFMRVHRSHIVNLERVEALRIDPPSGRYAVLDAGEDVPVSQNRWELLREALLGCSWE